MGLPFGHPNERRVKVLIEAAHEAAALRLLVSSSGNISVRLDRKRFAISRARSRLASLRRRDVIVESIDPAATRPSRWERRRRSAAGALPSRETPMHRALYRAFPELGSVLHFQSLAATTLACREGSLPNLSVIPEVPVYVRRIADVPYLPPGSEELAAAVTDALREGDTRLALLRNHGQLVVGDSPRQAVERAAFFELAARIALLSEGRGVLRPFTADEISILESY